MTLAYIVYFGLLVVLPGCWALAQRISSTDPAREKLIGGFAVLFTIVLFTAVIGGRYYVGGDYIGYIYYYNTTSTYDTPSNVVFEPGFFYVIQLLKLFDASDRSLIVASSFLQILFFSYWLSKKGPFAPFVVFFFITIVLLDVNNAIRQGIAIFAILIALDAINEKKALKFLLWLAAAYLFHRSALIVLPLGIVLWRVHVPKIAFQMTGLIASYALVGLFLDSVISLFSALSPVFGYEGYADVRRLDLTFGGGQASLNVGRYLWPVVDTVIILYSKKLAREYDAFGYRLYHVMFLVAAVLQPVALAWDFLPFARALFYFTAMRMVCLGFLARFCIIDSKRPRDMVLGMGVCLVFLLWLLVAVSRGAAASAPYRF